jgi:CDP-paratose 2-epimerase
MPLALIDGSCGPIGSEVGIHFSRAGFQVAGVDNNRRAVFFGSQS